MYLQMTERDLSDLTRERSEGVDEHVDEHFDINKQISGANYFHASTRHGHLNLVYGSGRNLHHVNIPNMKAKISDTKYGVVISA